jgi:hypothetical protein
MLFFLKPMLSVYFFLAMLVFLHVFASFTNCPPPPDPRLARLAADAMR